MRKTKQEKGITLIALIITIVVLLILAVVAINSIQNDGILSHAGNVENTYNQSVQNEQEQLKNYLNYLDKANGGTGSGDTVTQMTVAEAQTKGILNASANTEVVDEYGNKIVVPAGFRIRVDESTNNADNVTEGIVVEDGSGNQFVWIPTGNIKTSSTDKTGTNIMLARYIYDVTLDSNQNSITGTGAIVERYASATDVIQDPRWENAGVDMDFVEGRISGIAIDADGNDTKGYASNITDFINSAKPISENGNGGYYIGRYEARKNSTTNKLTTVSTDPVYNNITQPSATSESQSMYENTNFTSDLVNSFAWDTAIAFIQAFADSDYSSQSSLNYDLSTTGTTTDVKCNIYDMASNCLEWSTETTNNFDYPCTARGGVRGSFISYTCLRIRQKVTQSSDVNSFRPILYV